MKIKFYTNIVANGWSALDLETGIGGSEEKLIELARELAKENDVTVYMNGTHGVFDNVKYEDHRNFIPWEYCDIFVSFKASYVFSNSINAGKIIHFSTEIETYSEQMIKDVDKIFAISDYHKRKLNGDKLNTFYLWADFERLGKNKVKKKTNSMLYSASYDRGLEELLVNWDLVKTKLGVDTLVITYGWDFMKESIKINPSLRHWKERLDKLMDRADIIQLGRITNDEMCKVYWESKYWCLPLNNPDSELFCINAIKAQYAGAIPVVRKIGALQETVNECINWDELIGRPNHVSTFKEGSIERNKEHASKFNLTDAITRFTNETR